MKYLLRFVFASALLAGASPASLADHAKVKVVGVRETVGSVTVRGWEHSLIQSDANLGHWQWMPMYANVQAMKYVAQSTPPPLVMTPAKPREHYVKPIHVAAPVINHPALVIKKQPVEKPAHEAKQPVASDAQVAGQLRHEDVSALLRNDRVAGTLAQPSTYGNLYNKSTAANLYNKDTSANLYNKAVQAVIVPKTSKTMPQALKSTTMPQAVTTTRQQSVKGTLMPRTVYTTKPQAMKAENMPQAVTTTMPQAVRAPMPSAPKPAVLPQPVAPQPAPATPQPVPTASYGDKFDTTSVSSQTASSQHASVHAEMAHSSPASNQRRAHKTGRSVDF